MVKKVAKSATTVKKTVKKAASTVQKTLIKENKHEKLSNGYVKESLEMEKEENTVKSNEEIASNTDNERLADMESNETEDTTSETQKNADVEVKEMQEEVPSSNVKEASKSKTAPKSRKRKADVDEKKVITKTKTKKQKVVFEIPEISAVVGKVFVAGSNEVGQLGFNSDDVMEKRRPALLEMPYSIVDIAAGGMHSVCLTQTGEVITFGCNDEGALGRETEDGSEYIPRKVDIPEKIVQISAGDSHTAALSESGQVYLWGNFRNNRGVMGLTRPEMKQTLPVKILHGVTVVKIASGSDHLSCLSNEGLVYTCGNGEAGQLGRVSEHASENGGRKGITLLLSPQTVAVKQTRGAVISDVWTCSLATFLKSNNGAIYAFGLNNFGQLGLSPDERAIWKPKQIETFKNKNWSQINGGQHHTLALDNEGLVYSLGRSEYGRLGLGENCGDVSKPTSISSLEDKKCINISCGNCESFALEDNGSVYSWGMGTNNQLGHGNDNDQYTPKLIEGNFYNSWKALKVSGGGQHTLILAHPRNTTEEGQ